MSLPTFLVWFRNESGWGQEISLAYKQLAVDAWNAAIEEALNCTTIQDPIKRRETLEELKYERR